MTQPVANGRQGFTPAEVAGFHANWEWRDILRYTDVARYMFLHLSEFFPSTTVRRSGDVMALDQAPDARIGAIRLPAGRESLEAYLGGDVSQAQGLIVSHEGKIVFERYPGMREDDSHITMSVAKTMPSLIIDLLEEDGKIDTQRTVGSYVPALADTAWHKVKVIDVLNMASGLDIVENDQNRDDVQSTFGRFLRAVLNVPGPHGIVEKHTDVIRSAQKLREPGHIFDYSSLNTQVLVLLAEAVENQCWADIFQDRVWGKMYAEGDAQILVTPDGIPMAFGLMSMRLRDLVRFGMLYTPSWKCAAREHVIGASIVQNIRDGALNSRRPKLLQGDIPVESSRHWDRVLANGDFYKGGLHGQGLYVSPGKDLVIAWYSTTAVTALPAYAIAISNLYEL